jgi:hypothetical protein
MVKMQNMWNHQAVDFAGMGRWLSWCDNKSDPSTTFYRFDESQVLLHYFHPRRSTFHA